MSLHWPESPGQWNWKAPVHSSAIMAPCPMGIEWRIASLRSLFSGRMVTPPHPRPPTPFFKQRCDWQLLSPGCDWQGRALIPNHFVAWHDNDSDPSPRAEMDRRGFIVGAAGRWGLFSFLFFKKGVGRDSRLSLSSDFKPSFLNSAFIWREETSPSHDVDGCWQRGFHLLAEVIHLQLQLFNEMVISTANMMMMINTISNIN